MKGRQIAEDWPSLGELPELPCPSPPASAQAMEERFALHMREVQGGIKASIDSLSRTFAELHNSLREERDLRRQEQAQLESTLLARVDEVQARTRPPDTTYGRGGCAAPGKARQLRDGVQS